nr:MAG TPA: hypothetical protein [Caudoviricetes sp.]
MASYKLKEFVEASKLMDLTDKETYISVGVVNEAEQREVLLGITNRLYEKIEAKVTDVDFGTIPQSKGDFLKIDNIDMVTEAITDMKQIYQEYKQPLTYINTITEAINNLVELKNEFQRSFLTNTSLGVVLYNTTALSVISSVSLLISSTIDFIVDPRTKSIEVSVDRVGVAKSKELLQLQTLAEFNNLCKGGKLKKVLNDLIKVSTKNLAGTSVLAIIGVSIGLIFTIVPIMRELIYYFYYCRASVAEYFETQIAMLSLNAARLETAGDPKTANEQRKYVDRFRKIADFLAVDAKEATNKAEANVKQDEKEKYKIDDVTESLPDSAASSLF